MNEQLIQNYKTVVRSLDDFINNHEKELLPMETAKLYSLLSNTIYRVMFEFAHLGEGTPAESFVVIKEMHENAIREHESLILRGNIH